VVSSNSIGGVVVADRGQVVDVADQWPLRAGLEVAGDDRAAQQHRAAVLVQGGDQSQP
jgi:hypothetical protein